MRRYILFTLILSFVCSCTIQKRTFNKGYFIQWNKKYEKKSNEIIFSDENEIVTNKIEKIESSELLEEYYLIPIYGEDKVKENIETDHTPFQKSISKPSEIKGQDFQTKNKEKQTQIKKNSRNIHKNQSRLQRNINLLLIFSAVLFVLGLLMIFFGIQSGLILGILLLLLGIFSIVFSIVFLLLFLIALGFSARR